MSFIISPQAQSLLPTTCLPHAQSFHAKGGPQQDTTYQAQHGMGEMSLRIVFDLLLICSKGCMGPLAKLVCSLKTPDMAPIHTGFHYAFLWVDEPLVEYSSWTSFVVAHEGCTV